MEYRLERQRCIRDSSDIENEWTIAVQWHPEMTVSDELQFGLVKAFVEEARRRRPAGTIEDSR